MSLISKNQWRKLISYVFASETTKKLKKCIYISFWLTFPWNEMLDIGDTVYTETPSHRFFDGNPRPRYFANAKVLICRFPSNDRWRCLIDSAPFSPHTWMQTATWWCAKCKIARWKLCMHLSAYRWKEWKGIERGNLRRNEAFVNSRLVSRFYTSWWTIASFQSWILCSLYPLWKGK